MSSGPTRNGDAGQVSRGDNRSWSEQPRILLKAAEILQLDKSLMLAFTPDVPPGSCAGESSTILTHFSAAAERGGNRQSVGKWLVCVAVALGAFSLILALMAPLVLRDGCVKPVVEYRP